MRPAILGVVMGLVAAASVVSCYNLDAFGPSRGNELDGAIVDGSNVADAMDAASAVDAPSGIDATTDAPSPVDATTDAPSPVDATTDGALWTAAISLSSSAANFGLVPCGKQANPLAIVITNTSDASEQVTETLLGDGGPFSVALETPAGPASTTTLAPAGTVTMLVSALPLPTTSSVAPDFYRGTITITTNPPLESSPQIPLTETAAGAILQISRALVSFGPVAVGTTATLALEVGDVGNEPASITPAVSGVGFSVAGLNLDGGVVADAGAAASFSVAYSPTTTASSLGFLTIAAGVTCAPTPTAVIVGGTASILAAGQATAAGIAVDSTSVYWTNAAELQGGVGASVMRAPIAGVPEGGAPTTLASVQATPVAIVVDVERVYWANSPGALMEVPIGGGDAGVVVPNAGLSLGAGIAQNATNLYWAGRDSVMTVPKTGGAPTTLASGQTGAFSVAVDSTSIYWTATGSGNGTGTVRKAPLSGVPDGGTATILASGLSSPAAIVVDATTVYWVNTGGSPNLMKVPLSGGSATMLTPVPSPVLTGLAGLAVDATNVYVACGNLELSVPLDGGAAVTLATGSLAVGLAENDASVFWTDNLGGLGGASNGVVVSIPK